MPNWCDNVAVFQHDDSLQIEKLVDAYNSGKVMETFCPCPKELRETKSGFFGEGTPEQKALEKKEKRNEKKYGYKNWYDWCVGEWGTKWDIGKSEYKKPKRVSPEATKVVLNFDSAWSPPIEFYRKCNATSGLRSRRHSAN
jgi:hypothetical protein